MIRGCLTPAMKKPRVIKLRGLRHFLTFSFSWGYCSPKLELPRFSGRFISCDSFGFMGNSAGGLLKVHGREISEC